MEDRADVLLSINRPRPVLFCLSKTAVIKEIAFPLHMLCSKNVDLAVEINIMKFSTSLSVYVSINGWYSENWPESPLHLSIHLGNYEMDLAGIFEIKIILMTSSSFFSLCDIFPHSTIY